MTKKQRAVKRALVDCADRRTELRIEGYLAARNSQTRRLDKPECPYVGWEADAWEVGWGVASKDLDKWQ